MKDMTISSLSEKAILYKNSDISRAKKNRLFMEIADHYLPFVNKKLLDISKRDKEDFMQIYYQELTVALNKWNYKANFETYAYSYIRFCMNIFMKQLKGKDKSDMEIISTENIPFGDELSSDQIYDFFLENTIDKYEEIDDDGKSKKRKLL